MDGEDLLEDATRGQFRDCGKRGKWGRGHESRSHVNQLANLDGQTHGNLPDAHLSAIMDLKYLLMKVKCGSGPVYSGGGGRVVQMCAVFGLGS